MSEGPPSEGSGADGSAADGSAAEGSLPESPADEDSLPESPADEDSLPDASALLAAERAAATRASLDAEQGGGAGWDVAEPADPEWLLIVVRVDAVGAAGAGEAAAPDAGEARFALVRRGEGAPLELLGVAAPGPSEGLDQVVGDALWTRLGLELVGEVLLSERRVPRRAAQWRAGRVATGWARAVAARAVGEPLAPPPLFEVRLLPLAEAEAALATSAERELLRAGAGAGGRRA